MSGNLVRHALFVASSFRRCTAGRWWRVRRVDRFERWMSRRSQSQRPASGGRGICGSERASGEGGSENLSSVFLRPHESTRSGPSGSGPSVAGIRAGSLGRGYRVPPIRRRGCRPLSDRLYRARAEVVAPIATRVGCVRSLAICRWGTGRAACAWFSDVQRSLGCRNRDVPHRRIAHLVCNLQPASHEATHWRNAGLTNRVRRQTAPRRPSVARLPMRRSWLRGTTLRPTSATGWLWRNF
jgi:hypothetical protein